MAKIISAAYSLDDAGAVISLHTSHGCLTIGVSGSSVFNEEFDGTKELQILAVFRLQVSLKKHKLQSVLLGLKPLLFLLQLLDTLSLLNKVTY